MRWKFLNLLFLFLSWSPAAFAQEALGIPKDKQIDFQDAASPVMDKIHHFHDFLLVITIAITVFVMGLLLWVIVRYNAKANPVPSKTTHHVGLEIAWTLVPILILLVIVVPSMRLLYFADKAPNAEMTIKAIGKQWYWTYEYPDHGNFTFDAYLLKDAEAKAAGLPRLLATDNYVVLPIDTNIRILVTAGDVLHSFAVPALGVKKDGVPGRLNETWARIEKPGIYYGQCSELCGTNHGFMPIAIKAVPKAEFEEWVKKAQEKFPKAEGSAWLDTHPTLILAKAN